MTPFRRLLSGYLHPLVVTALDYSGPDALFIDPELLWAARMAEFEAVEIWAQTNHRFTTHLRIGPVGEVQVHGSLAQHFKRGDSLSVATFVFVPTGLMTEHSAYFVQVGSHNQAIQIRCRTTKPMDVHPSYAPPNPTWNGSSVMSAAREQVAVPIG